MRIVVFGTGRFYEEIKDRLYSFRRVVFLDNSKEKQGTWLDGVYIDAPKNIGNYQYDYVFITSDFYSEMRRQLLELGVSEEKILDKEHPGIFQKLSITCKYIPETYMPSIGANKKVLLFSHELSLTGAPRVLFNMALCLKKAGYDVEIYALKKGEMLYEYLEQGIPVTCSLAVEKEITLDVEAIVKNYNIVVVNTIALYNIVKQLNNKELPVIWWIHEVEKMYAGCGIQGTDIQVGDNIHVYGVGPKAIEEYHRYFNQYGMQELLYGIEPMHIKNEGVHPGKEKLVFAVIASLEKRKGQDILEEAVNLHWEEWKNKAEFWVIGKTLPSYKGNSETRGVIYLGEKEKNQIQEIYEQIDVCVCPSRYDTMPVVLAEGMMLKKACILSDSVGTAGYVKSFENALVFENENVESLATTIQWCLDNRERLKTIGKQGYEIFQNKFSYEQFEKNVNEIIGKYLEQ